MDNELPKQNKLKQFFFKHIVSFLLLIILIVVYVWFNMKINTIEKNNTKQKQEIENTYTLKIDSIELSTIKLTSKVLSWAVRSELLRENTEQIDQFFNNFVKEKNINRVDLIEPVTGAIVKSTDKKLEGTMANGKMLNSVDIVENDSSTLSLINPILGLDKTIGILVITIKK